MCGIVGFYDEKQFDAENAPAVIRKMNQTLIHRGPDEEGSWIKAPAAFGMRRLSIVDLKTGHQPILNEDSTLVLVANGEIYNSPELRDKLERKGHSFKTKSDVEVILHLYEDSGVHLLDEISGMFGFALWDEKNQTLLLARDRIGIKPLFYALEDSRLVFASEIKALFPALRKKPALRLQSLWDYLTLGYIPAPNTIYENIFKLMPAHYLISKNGEQKIQSYWKLKPVSDPPKSFPEACEAMYSSLKKAVQSHLMSDVPLGVLLSGGIDSSALVSFMTELGAPVKTFSLGFEEESYNELPQARLTAERFGTEHYEKVLTLMDAQKIIELLPYFDEPFQDSSCLPTFYISQLAGSQVKTVLSGEGGDELFAGYFTYEADKIAAYYDWFPKFFRKKIFPGFARLLPVTDGKLSFDYFVKKFVEQADGDFIERHLGWRTLFPEEIKQELLLPHGLNPTIPKLKEIFKTMDGHFDSFNQLLCFDTQFPLVDDLLTKVDRMSMAVSLEARVPFLDHQVVELAFSLPFSYKLRGLTKKYILKKMMKGKLPDEILNRKKGGFSIPLAAWLRKEPLKSLTAEVLSEANLKKSQLFNPEKVKEILETHSQRKKDYSRQIWALLVFQLWNDAYKKLSVP